MLPPATASPPAAPADTALVDRGRHRRKCGSVEHSRPPNTLGLRQPCSRDGLTGDSSLHCNFQPPLECAVSGPCVSPVKFISRPHAVCNSHSKAMHLCGNERWLLPKSRAPSVLHSWGGPDSELLLLRESESSVDSRQPYQPSSLPISNSFISLDGVTHSRLETCSQSEETSPDESGMSFFCTEGVAHLLSARISEYIFSVPNVCLIRAKDSFISRCPAGEPRCPETPVIQGSSLPNVKAPRELRRKPFPVSPLSDLLITRSLLLILLVLSALPTVLRASESPPRYSRDAMPNTSFTCDDKASGGYYADPDADCQMFHVCVRVSEDEIRDHKFLCPNDTIFDQQNFICASWWDTECKKQATYDDKNELIRSNDPWATQAPAVESEDKLTEEEELYYDYLLEYGNANRPTGASEYEYQYYETGDAESRAVGSRRDKDLDYEQPSISRSVSKSKSTVNKLLPSSGYVISTNVGSQSTLKPVLVTMSSERPVISTTTRKSNLKSATTTTTTEATFLSPFKASFEVGKPVVSISSTSSRFEVSSPRYLPSTPRYGYFSVAHPSTTPPYAHQSSSTYPTSTSSPRTTRSSTTTTTTTTTSTTTTTTTPQSPTSKPLDSQDDVAYENVKEFKAEDLVSYSDSEDPFANIDWKKDSSGVTATTRTRYETAFGPAAVERRISSTLRPLARRRTLSPTSEKAETKVEAPEPLKTVSVTSSSSSSVGPRTVVTATQLAGRRPRNRAFFSRGSATRENDAKERDSVPHQRRKRIYTGPSRQDFSNFRYFKTAFGSTESAPTTPKSTRLHRSRLSSVRVGEPVISRRRGRISSDSPAKIASRNTRYSIYA